MQSEAKYLINFLNLGKIENKNRLQHFYGEVGSYKISLFFQEKINNFEKIGTVQGALLTYKSIQIDRPDFILNFGTCGAIEKSGIQILDIVCSNNFLIYHDRFTIESLENYSVGKHPCEPQKLLFKDAIPVILGTSNSLIINNHNAETIKKYNVSCLDMEAAAIAEICQEEGIKFIALKVVTDIVCLNKHSSNTESQFINNFKPAMEKISSYIKNELIK